MNYNNQIRYKRIFDLLETQIDNKFYKITTLNILIRRIKILKEFQFNLVATKNIFGYNTKAGETYLSPKLCTIATAIGNNKMFQWFINYINFQKKMMKNEKSGF